jgi:hypothetical protein
MTDDEFEGKVFAVRRAIEAGSVGFAGGFVSSKFLRDLFPSGGGKLKELMRSLGYLPHPAFAKGQTNNSVLPDNCKVTLYVRRESDDDDPPMWLPEQQLCERE